LCAGEGKLPAKSREVFSVWIDEVGGNLKPRGLDGFEFVTTPGVEITHEPGKAIC